MGFFEPSPPPFDLEEWKAKPHLARLKPLVQDWGAERLRLADLRLPALRVQAGHLRVGALLVISLTPGPRRARRPRRLVDAADRLREVRRLDAALGDPRPRRRLDAAQLPLRAADRRAALLAAAGNDPAAAVAGQGPVDEGDRGAPRSTSSSTPACSPRRSSCSPPPASTPAAARPGKLPPAGIAVLLGFLVLLGLRDKVSFLGARPEIYGTMLVVGLFPIDQWIVAWQFVFLFIWWGAASSKLNHHFPFVVSTMISNAPLIRSKAFKRRLWRDYPEDMRPSRLSAAIAHFGTVQEFGWPLLLITVDNDTIRTIAIVGMILFHLNITSMFPLAVPLEWNLFMIFGLLFLFGHYGDVPLSTLDDPLLIAFLRSRCIVLPVLGGTAARQDLLPALDALLRRQLGDDASGCSARAAGRRRSSTPEIKKAARIDRRAGRRDLRPARSPSSCSTRGSPSARCTRTGAR